MCTPDFPIADAHFHIWTPDTHPWLKDAAATPPKPGHFHKGPVAHDYLLDDYMSDIRAANLNVHKGVFIQADWQSNKSDPVDEPKWVKQMTQNNRHGMKIGIVGFVDLDQPEKAKQQLEGHMQLPEFKGVRFMLDYNPEIPALNQTSRGDWMQQPGFLSGMKLLEDNGLTFDLQVCQIQLPAAVQLVKRFPGINFVLNHTGFPLGGARDAALFDEWKSGIRELAAVPNTYAKIGALNNYDESLGFGAWSVGTMQPYVDETLKAFGVDRCMWSTNLPVDKLVGEFPLRQAALMECIGGLSEEEKRQFLCKTAETVYRL